jgi:hypothetical protein
VGLIVGTVALHRPSWATLEQTMSNGTYNGWTNYATWRVNLEVFDGLQATEMFDLGQHPYDLGIDLRLYAEEMIESTSNEGLARDYAFAFILDVNWQEIANHLIEAWVTE